MRLRQRLLLLFFVFAIVPLVGIGAWGYARSVRSLDNLVGAQSDQLAERAAATLQDRLDVQASDIAFLAGNAETQRVLGDMATRPPSGDIPSDPRFTAFIHQVWENIKPTYFRMQILDGRGRVILDIEEPAIRAPQRPAIASSLALSRPILHTERGDTLGQLQLWPRSEAMFGGAALRETFGRRGSMHVLNRSGRQVIETAVAPDLLREEEASRLGALDWSDRRSRKILEVGGERRVASAVNLEAPAWSVVSVASVTEFAAPFARQRLVDLGLLFLVVGIVSAGFVLLLRRATRTLDELSAAAAHVGQGDFAPELPPVGTDEVGRLSEAFRVMTGRVREMIAQVEASRQTAVLGRFATELAHEIRNPLTAIKLHLQGLERDSRDGRLPSDSVTAVSLALREIHRLDHAVRTALRSGRPETLARPYALNRVMEDAVRLLEPEAAAQGVILEVRKTAERDMVVGDPEAAKGAILNLVLNAIQAMPEGGLVTAASRIMTRGGREEIEITIADQGPGIPESLRDRIFRPFFTTKDGGSGLGLPMARETAQAHGGTLEVREGSPRGAELAMRIPLATASAS